MTYQQILDILDGTAYHSCKTYEGARITNFVASDLMSDVLTVDDENFVLITSLTSDQVVRTADIVGARGILLVNDKVPQERLIELAREFDISLLKTPHRMFKTCAILSQSLQQEGIII